jgi:leucyl aminopeptidase
MDLGVAGQDPARIATDALIVPVARTKDARTRPLPDDLARLDESLGGAIRTALAKELFSGRADELHSFASQGIGAPVVVLVGLGDPAAITLEGARRAAGSAVRAAARGERSQVAFWVRGFGDLPQLALGQALAEGAVLGQYRFDRYQRADDDAGRGRLKKVTLLCESESPELKQGMQTGRVIAESTAFARDLSNEPGAVMTPARLAKEAQAMARKVGLRCKVLGRRELEAQKMGGILAVGCGSANEPRLIILEHGIGAGGRKGAAKGKQPTIALVGKGITFDTGGISIKPAENMDAMKSDMSGGAAVIAALRAVALLKLPMRVVGIVPAAENRPSSTSYLPGDVVQTAAGVTIEILNTDAEGRVVLADGLHCAQSYKPDAIVDIATLTGAKIIALGTHCCAVMGNDEPLMQRLRAAGDRAHERVWPLPLWDEYKEQVRSDIADVKNTGGREGGSITAAALLARFVGDFPWAHLDIAGNERTGSAKPYTPKGATGFGVRLLVEFLRSWLDERR